MAYIEQHLPCPKCDSTDAYSIDDRGWGHCFSCGVNIKTDGSVEYTKPKSKMQKEAKFVENGEIRAIQSRKISEETCRFFNYQVGEAFNPHPSVNAVEPCHIANFIEDGELLAQKVRFPTIKVKNKEEKPFMSLGDVNRLYGKGLWKSGKIIVITEGELDALSYAEATNCKYPVVSLPNGVQSAVKVITKELEWLESNFDKIVLLFDMDKQGQEAAKKVAQLFSPHKCAIGTLSEKDASDMLIKGKVEELVNSVFRARPYRPDGIVTVGDIRSRITQKPEWGLSYPFPTLTDLTYGLKTGELSIWTSGSGMGKCLGKGTELLKSDGTVVKVEDVRVGDRLLGPFQNNKVKSLAQGVSTLYRITPTKGESYVVNDSHILSLYASRTYKNFVKGEVYNIDIKSFLKLTKKEQTLLKTWRPKYVQFSSVFKHQYDCYVIGLWLGDGRTTAPILYNKDRLLLNVWGNYGKKLGYTVTSYSEKPPLEALAFTGVKGKENKFFKYLRDNFIKDGEKSIKAKNLSFSDRQNLLAGIIDTDGSVTSCGTGFEITLSLKGLTEDVAFIARSLGLMVTQRIKVVSGVEYYKLYIFGEKLHEIPTLLKKVKKRKSPRNSLTYGFTVEKLKKGKYYGFELEGDKLFLLKDFQVTHNTEIFKSIAGHLIGEHEKRVGLLFLEEKPEQTALSIAGKLAGKRFDSPKISFDEAERDKYLDKLDNSGLLLLNDGFGFNDWPTIKSRIRYLIVAENCKYIFLDHLTAFTDGLAGSEANSLMEDMMKTLSSYAVDLDACINCISHIRKSSQDSKSAEEGGRISADSMKGSGAIKQWAFNIFALERNQQSQDEEKRNVSIIRPVKLRNAGENVGKLVSIKYFPETGQLSELTNFTDVSIIDGAGKGKEFV